MAEKNGFEDLKRDFPLFEVKNKLSVAKTLDLIGDDDVVVPPRTTIKLGSDKFYQVPDNSIFQMVSPNASDLVEYGLIKKAAPAEEPKPAVADTPVDPSVEESKVTETPLDEESKPDGADVEVSDPPESEEETETSETALEEKSTKAVAGKRNK